MSLCLALRTKYPFRLVCLFFAHQSWIHYCFSREYKIMGSARPVRCSTGSSRVDTHQGRIEPLDLPFLWFSARPQQSAETHLYVILFWPLLLACSFYLRSAGQPPLSDLVASTCFGRLALQSPSFSPGPTRRCWLRPRLPPISRTLVGSPWDRGSCFQPRSGRRQTFAAYHT